MYVWCYVICGDSQVGLSTIIRFVFGGSLAASVFIAGAVTVLYTGAGGLLSVAYTGETLQTVTVLIHPLAAVSDVFSVRGKTPKLRMSSSVVYVLYNDRNIL